MFAGIEIETGRIADGLKDNIVLLCQTLWNVICRMVGKGGKHVGEFRLKRAFPLFHFGDTRFQRRNLCLQPFGLILVACAHGAADRL